MTQHNDHCILNVDWMPARILRMDGVRVDLERAGVIVRADLTGFDWDGYHAAFEKWHAEQRAEAAQRKAARDRGEAEREELKAGRREQAAEQKRQDRLWLQHASVPWWAGWSDSDFYYHVETGENRCFSTADELETEVVLADLEFVDAELIGAVDCERSRLRDGNPRSA